MTSSNRKTSGLAVCALIAAWLFATDISNRVDDVASVGDYASDKVDRLETKVDGLEGEVSSQTGN